MNQGSEPEEGFAMRCRTMLGAGLVAIAAVASQPAAAAHALQPAVSDRPNTASRPCAAQGAEATPRAGNAGRLAPGPPTWWPSSQRVGAVRQRAPTDGDDDTRWTVGIAAGLLALVALAAARR